MYQRHLENLSTLNVLGYRGREKKSAFLTLCVKDPGRGQPEVLPPSLRKLGARAGGGHTRWLSHSWMIPSPAAHLSITPCRSSPPTHVQREGQRGEKEEWLGICSGWLVGVCSQCVAFLPSSKSAFPHQPLFGSLCLVGCGLEGSSHGHP